MLDFEPNQEPTLNVCDEFAPMICALVDGELEHSESRRLIQHLAQCQGCSDWMASIGAVDAALVQSLDARPETGVGSSPLVSSMGGNWLSRLVPLATAAAVLVGIGIVATPPGNPKLTAEQIATPINDLQFLYDQRERDQQTLLKMLELELRSFRLELAQLEELAADSSAESTRLDQMIDSLIKQVKHLESSISNFDTGVESENEN